MALERAARPHKVSLVSTQHTFWRGCVPSPTPCWSWAGLWWKRVLGISWEVFHALCRGADLHLSVGICQLVHCHSIFTLQHCVNAWGTGISVEHELHLVQSVP